MIHETTRRSLVAETQRRSWTYEALVTEGLDADRYEVADGELVAVAPMDLKGARVLAKLTYLLYGHVSSTGLGEVYAANARFELREEPRRERMPDLAFLARERLPAPPEPDQYPGAPDLAVEVLSPSDSTKRARDKAHEYLEHGAREVWLVDPQLESVTVFRPGEPTRSYGHGDVLQSQELLPDLSLPMDELFAAS